MGSDRYTWELRGSSGGSSDVVCDKHRTPLTCHECGELPEAVRQLIRELVQVADYIGCVPDMRHLEKANKAMEKARAMLKEEIL